jgi:PadR family transcriptional regulator PadR
MSEARTNVLGGRGMAQLRRGVLEYCVLALLHEEPRYGLAVIRTLERWTA